MKINNLPLTEVSVDVSEDVGVKDATVSLSKSLITKLTELMESGTDANGQALSLADLRDISTMIKDTSVLIGKVGSEDVGNKDKLALFISRLGV